MKKKDLNEIAKIEKAIKDKYGEDAIQNPKSTWNEQKEKKYLKSLEDFYCKKKKQQKTEQAEGFVIKNRSKTKLQSRTCPVCGAYSHNVYDDLYMTKFKCCFECYIQYVEGREERWNSGWRPND